MNYELKINQLLQTGVQQLQILSSKINQSTIGQLARRTIIQLRKISLNEYLKNNLESAHCAILVVNLVAVIFLGLIFRNLESKVKKSDQSPQKRANQKIKIFTTTTLAINTGLYLFTTFPTNSSWLIGLTLVQTIAATVFFKNRELKEYQQVTLNSENKNRQKLLVVKSGQQRKIDDLKNKVGKQIFKISRLLKKNSNQQIEINKLKNRLKEQTFEAEKKKSFKTEWWPFSN
jgi:hypothetical protein